MNRDEVKAKMLHAVETFFDSLPPEDEFEYMNVMLVTGTEIKAHQAVALDGEISPCTLSQNVAQFIEKLGDIIAPRESETANDPNLPI